MFNSFITFINSKDEKNQNQFDRTQETKPYLSTSYIFASVEIL